MRKDYPICGSFNRQRFSNIDAERTINMFEYIDPKGKRTQSMLPTSGLVDSEVVMTPVAGTGHRPGGAFVFRDKTYNVVGNSVFRTNTALVTTRLDEISTSIGYVGIDANQFQIIFVDGDKGFIWDDDALVFKEITDPAFPENPIDVTFLDGFFIVANGGTNTFQLSSLNNGLVWGPGGGTTTSAGDTVTLVAPLTSLQFQVGTPVAVTGMGLVSGTFFVVEVVNATQIKISATKGGAAVPVAGAGTIDNNGQLQLGTINSHPGTIVACRTLHRRLFLFSQNFTEVHENAGIGANLPIRRNNNFLIEYGTPAIGSVSTGFDKMFFLSQDADGLGAVMMVQGAEAQPVSIQPLDFDLAQFAAEPTTLGVEDAVGLLLKENGLITYRLNFTRANHTYVFGVSTSESAQALLWHEEEILNGDRHPAQSHVFFNGKNFVGSYDANTWFILDPNVFTNNGQAIRRARIGQTLAPEGYNRTRVDRFHLDVMQGVDLVNWQVGNFNLLTEDGAGFGSLEILTEDGNNIITEQDFRFPDIQIPKVWLSISKDGGHIFGYKTEAPMGQVGETTFRTVWRKLGTIPRGQGYTPKIEFYSKSPFVVLGAAWDFEIMPE